MKKLFEKIPDKKNNSQLTKSTGRKPAAAGNTAFRLHNRLRFSRTTAQKEIGKANKI